ncbi:hypothetical protein PR048_001111 [Dryococelus australis]|uniref:Uncharacterized protein n=1 Tax=Dryococelus australis TaxID=614101 RepID=A0ABQ9IGG1_9NEOP|nr:hypothetical protein PR048_001111 [Dryococelus australis]
MAEYSVQMAKNALRCMVGQDTEVELPRYLLMHRNTPKLATGKSPAEMMFNRRLKTVLDRSMAELVWERKHSSDIWKPAVILNQEGNMCYRIWLANSCVSIRHVDQLRGRCQDKQNPPEGGEKQGLEQWPMVKDSDVKTRAEESQEIQNGRKSTQELETTEHTNIHSSKQLRERSSSDNAVVAQPTAEWCLGRSHPVHQPGEEGSKVPELLRSQRTRTDGNSTYRDSIL